MKKTMILALSAMMMAAGSVTVNAQEKVVTLDQLLKKNQEQKQAQTPQKQEQKAKPETKQQTQKQPKEKAQKQPKSSAAAAGLMAPVGFSTVYLQYNFESQKVKSGSHSDSESGNSVSAGYNYAFPISGTLPLYVEAGIAAKYVWQNETVRKFNMLSAKVPVNLLFSYPVNESFSIEPYAGLYLRGNIFGKFPVSTGTILHLLGSASHIIGDSTHFSAELKLWPQTETEVLVSGIATKPLQVTWNGKKINFDWNPEHQALVMKLMGKGTLKVN